MNDGYEKALNWAARTLAAWPHAAGSQVYIQERESVGHSMWENQPAQHPGVFFRIGKADWERRRREIENRPSWKLAPEAATHLVFYPAIGKTGAWGWVTSNSEPEALCQESEERHMKGWGRCTPTVSKPKFHGELLGTWPEDGIEARPEAEAPEGQMSEAEFLDAVADCLPKPSDPHFEGKKARLKAVIEDFDLDTAKQCPPDARQEFLDMLTGKTPIPSYDPQQVETEARPAAEEPTPEHRRSGVIHGRLLSITLDGKEMSSLAEALGDAADQMAGFDVAEELADFDAANDLLDAWGDIDHPYNPLADALVGAYKQAAFGKGKERHANDLPFGDQPMQTISELLNSGDGMAYQVIKKVQESTRMDTDAAIRELYGAIVYAAGMIVRLEGIREAEETEEEDEFDV